MTVVFRRLVCLSGGKSVMFRNQDFNRRLIGGFIVTSIGNFPSSLFCRDLRAYQRECFSEAELLPGADKLIRHLHDKGIPIAIATGSDKESYDIKVARHQDFIRLVVKRCALCFMYFE